MKEKINHVAEMNDPVRRHGYTAAGGLYLPNAEAWELFEMDRVYMEQFEHIPPPIMFDRSTIELPPPLLWEPRRSIWNRYLLYGALLGVAEVLIVLYSLFGGH